MGNKGSGSGGGGILAVIGIIAALIAARFAAPSIFNVIKIIGIVAVIAIIALVVLFIILGNKASNEDIKQKKKASFGGKTISEENAGILRKGRENLMELRRIMMRVNSVEIRSKGNEVCGLIDKILQTLREKPEKIPNVRQFFNYYLPTLGEVICKFERFEESGVPAGEMTAKVDTYLTDVKTAMNRQYENLFAKDVLDMTVEMEAMTLTAKKEGLLDKDGVQFKDKNGQTLNLTL